jgi:PIN domain nuclease of toxin-antitoxin system
MNGLLLDTHAFIWFSEDSPKLPVSVKQAIEDADHVYLSIASLWEIAIKTSLGKLPLLVPYADIERQLPHMGIELMPISFADTTHLLTLPFHHRDPFDRLLIAQAIARQMVLVSADGEFGPYPVKRLWA